MTVEELVKEPASWLDGSGPMSSVVLSSRVRLARNLKAYSFTNRSQDSELAKILDQFSRVVKESTFLRKGMLVHIGKLKKLERDFLVERHLISPDLAKGDKNQGLYVGDREAVSVMINEEDHIRLQAMRSGLQLREAWQIVDRIDDELSKHMDYAFSDQYGYLTACPTNVGTGLRASVLIHLPALVLTKDINEILQGIGQVGLAVRGFYGEGTEVLGNLFQMSNRTTLGRSEEDIVDDIEQATRKIIDYEENARKTLLTDARPQIEDKIWRAFGILKTARVLSSQELMSLISAVRLGVGLKMIQSISIASLNHLIMLLQPAHLQKWFNKKMDAGERDIRRAELVREKLTTLSGYAEDDGQPRQGGSLR
ncbi:protein arginine kinase [bacterium]|nr:protein arginine kinase [bacterium]